MKGGLMGSFKEAYTKKIKTPMIELMRSGISPEKLALSLAFGVVGGVFPIPGLTTVPVVAMTFLFKLNPVAPILVNYACTPLNLATVPMFIYYGNAMFGKTDTKEFSVSDMLQGLKTDTWETAVAFKSILLNGILAWCIFIPFATAGLYMVFLPLMRVGIKKIRKNSSSTSPTNRKRK